MVQIVGDIKATRQALVQVTSKLCNHGYEMGTPRDSFFFPYQTKPVEGDLSLSYLIDHIHLLWVFKLENNGRGPSDYEETPMQGGLSALEYQLLDMLLKKLVEVVIPEHTIATLIGNGAKSIGQIIQISGAKVTLLEGRLGSNRVIEISSTVDQTHSAQSVLHALILNSHSSHGSYSD